jgi:hypothetical protein
MHKEAAGKVNYYSKANKHLKETIEELRKEIEAKMDEKDALIVKYDHVFAKTTARTTEMKKELDFVTK